MNLTILAFCMSYVSSLCTVNHQISIKAGDQSSSIRYEISKIRVSDFLNEKQKHLVFLDLMIVNNRSSPAELGYLNLNIQDSQFVKEKIQLHSINYLVADVIPTPITVGPGKSVKLELFFEAQALDGNYVLDTIEPKD